MTTHRQVTKPLYHLVPLILLKVVALARERGDVKYAPDDWKQGDVCFFIDCMNHTIEHLYKAVPCTDPAEIERHLGNAACNIAFILWALEQKILRPGHMAAAAALYLEARGKDA